MIVGSILLCGPFCTSGTQYCYGLAHWSQSRVWVLKIPAGQKNFQMSAISVPLANSSQLHYDEYTDRTLSVER